MSSQPSAPQPRCVYKICPHADWVAAQGSGVYGGAPIDARDGFIHLSTAAQAPETARLHFHGAQDLALLEVDAAALGAKLRYDPSRGGDLFPHLYGDLPVSAVLRVWRLTSDADGTPCLPELPK